MFSMDRSIGGYEDDFYDLADQLASVYPGIAHNFNQDSAEELFNIVGRISRRGTMGESELYDIQDFAGRVRERSSYDGGMSSEGWGGFTERPAFNALSNEHRLAYEITDRTAFMSGSGGFRYLEDEQEIEQQRAERAESIRQSMAYIGPNDRPVPSVQLPVSALDIRRALPNGAWPSGAARPAQPRQNGRYANKSKIDFDIIEMKQAQMAVGELIRKEILKNYDASSIATRTGTLRRAIEESEIEPSMNESGKDYTIKVTLANLTRPAQLGRDFSGQTENKKGEKISFTSEQVTTDFYGPMVFNGRRAFSASEGDYPYLRFYIPYEQANLSEQYGGWHTSSNVRASTPHPEVWNLSEENLKSISDRLLSAISKAMTISSTSEGGNSE